MGMYSDGIGLRRGFHFDEARRKIPRAHARGVSTADDEVDFVEMLKERLRCKNVGKNVAAY